jgi:hypothetical protein
MGRAELKLGAIMPAAGFALVLACSADTTDGGPDPRPQQAAGGAGVTTGAGGGVAGAGLSAGVGAGGGAGLTGTGGTGTGGASGTPGAGAGGNGGSGVPPSDAGNLSAIAANTTIGLEWDVVPGADSYHVYWSMTAGVTPQTGQRLVAMEPALVHRGLTNGTAYYYVVAAVSGGAEGEPSGEQTATPTGEWVLEEFGSGIVEDVRSGEPATRVPVAQRLHVLLFGEGYTAADMNLLHSVEAHDGQRNNDVDRWVDLVFGIEPYTAYRQAFVVWYLPRASNAHRGGDTAFAIPIDASGGVGQVQSDGETAVRTFAAIEAFPFPPTDFGGSSFGGGGTARNVVVAFMILDPERMRASSSGRALSLRNPANTEQRVQAAFGVGHAHEFTHALSSVRDEYLEDDNSAPMQTSETSNVAGTNVCGMLPWTHLLQGGAINPDQGDLVGAFGRPQHGYHSELLCLMNGTHDNAAYYGGDGLLRVEDRMCNFCREITAYRIHQRSGAIANGTEGFTVWKNEYRMAFFERFPFSIPSVVPQTNDARNPGEGMAIYEACTAADVQSLQLPAAGAESDHRAGGCVIDEL